MSRYHKLLSHPIVRMLLWFAGWFLLTTLLSLVLPGVTAKPIEGLSALIALILLVRFVEKRSLTEAGLGARGMALQIVLGFAFGAAIISAVIGAMALFGYYQIAAVVPVWSLLAINLWGYLWVAVMEEIALRGVLFRILEEWWGSWGALAFSAVVFGALHLPNQNSSLLAALAIAIEAGILLGAAFMLSRNLWLPIGIHWAWNFFEGPVFGTAVSGGLRKLSFIHPVVQGPAWATGGPFGPEASLFAVLIATAAGVAMVMGAMRKGHLVPPSWKRG